MLPIVRAVPVDAATLRVCLARAFFDDPVATWLFPARERRRSDLETFFAIQLRHGYLPRGVVATTEDRRSCAMWVGSWADPLGLADRLAHLRILLLMRARAGFARTLTRQLASLHPRAPHLYLGTIGTDPGFQRRGYASALLDELVADAERRAVGAYLECSRAENVALYARWGFEVTRELDAPDRGPRLWLMWRPPTHRRG